MTSRIVLRLTRAEWTAFNDAVHFAKQHISEEMGEHERVSGTFVRLCDCHDLLNAALDEWLDDKEGG